MSHSNMNTVATTNKYIYDILLKVQPDGTHQASVLGWADCQATAATAEAAIATVQEMLNQHLANAKIIRVEIDSNQVDPPPASYHHPWMTFAEKLKDNPLLDEVDRYIAESRRQSDENQAAEL
jgi:predicted RNase H-like HicB family nuclease